MRNYNSIINDKGVELQLYADRVKLIIGDITQYLSRDVKTDEDARLFCWDSEEMESRADIIFDYVNRMEQLGKTIELLSGKLLDNERVHRGKVS